MYAQLRAGIRDGAIEPAERLHEATLVTSFAANRNSVRRALQMLAVDGLVERRTHAGTSVASGIEGFSATSVLPLTSTAALTVDEIDQVVLATPPSVAERMKSTSPTTLAYLQLALLDDVPIYVRSGYAPELDAHETFFDDILAADKVLRPMAQAFWHLFHVELGTVETTIEWTAADAFTGELLNVAVGVPLLLREMLLTGVDGRARELSYTYFRGDRVSLLHSGTEPDQP
jgi:GntR family transcriptional regulator